MCHDPWVILFLSYSLVTKYSRIPQVEDECGSIPMVLVQNKIDLIDRAAIDA